MEAELERLSAALGAALNARKLQLACAESCTGGLVAAAVTATAGSSAWFERGFVTYSNAAKQEMLGVRAELLERQGAVSEATVRAMAAGAIARAHAQVAIAISGIAGPAGATIDKPVGTVCFAWRLPDDTIDVETRHFSGNRGAVRQQAAIHALNGLLARLESRGTVP